MVSLMNWLFSLVSTHVLVVVAWLWVGHGHEMNSLDEKNGTMARSRNKASLDLLPCECLFSAELMLSYLDPHMILSSWMHPIDAPAASTFHPVAARSIILATLKNHLQQLHTSPRKHDHPPPNHTH
jgi:hypothetical protein